MALDYKERDQRKPDDCRLGKASGNVSRSYEWTAQAHALSYLAKKRAAPARMKRAPLLRQGGAGSSQRLPPGWFDSR